MHWAAQSARAAPRVSDSGSASGPGDGQVLENIILYGDAGDPRTLVEELRTPILIEAFDYDSIGRSWARDCVRAWPP